MLDSHFFRIFQYYKTKYKAKANNIALVYILFLQGSMLLLLGTFFILFFNQMHVNILSIPKAWTLFALIIIILAFRNWLYYTGKKRKVLNTKNNKASTNNIWLLWLIPIVCLIFSILLMQRL